METRLTRAAFILRMGFIHVSVVMLCLAYRPVLPLSLYGDNAA